jgi:hypothetical protein
MNTSKLSQAHVYIIGLVAVFVLGLGLFFALINPKKGEVQDQTTKNNGLLSQLSAPAGATGAEADSARTTAINKGKTAKQKAETDAKIKEAQWRAVIERQSPPEDHRIPFGDYNARLPLMAGWWTLPDWVVRDASRFARSDRGVLTFAEFKSPGTSPDPNSVPPSPLVWNLGPMAATGSYSKVMQWARRWNQYHFTPAVDGLAVKLIGKGTVQATANLTLYVWSKEKPGSAPAAAAGGGGSPMGGSGGPGMSGMGGPAMSGMGSSMGGSSGKGAGGMAP